VRVDAREALRIGVDRVGIENAPLVFLGYGVKAPERNWDDFEGQCVRGRVGVVLINPTSRPGRGNGEEGQTSASVSGRGCRPSMSVKPHSCATAAATRTCPLRRSAPGSVRVRLRKLAADHASRVARSSSAPGSSPPLPAP